MEITQLYCYNFSHLLSTFLLKSQAFFLSLVNCTCYLSVKLALQLSIAQMILLRNATLIFCNIFSCNMTLGYSFCLSSSNWINTLCISKCYYYRDLHCIKTVPHIFFLIIRKKEFFVGQIMCVHNARGKSLPFNSFSMLFGIESRTEVKDSSCPA